MYQYSQGWLLLQEGEDMTKRKVYVRYWHGTKFSICPWENGEEVDYSLRFRVVQLCMDYGLNTMVLTNGDIITIFIDDKRFGQR